MAMAGVPRVQYPASIWDRNRWTEWGMTSRGASSSTMSRWEEGLPSSRRTVIDTWCGPGPNLSIAATWLNAPILPSISIFISSHQLSLFARISISPMRSPIVRSHAPSLLSKRSRRATSSDMVRSHVLSRRTSFSTSSSSSLIASRCLLDRNSCWSERRRSSSLARACSTRAGFTPSKPESSLSISAGVSTPSLHLRRPSTLPRWAL
mmetsp:Transcript_25920/g.62243  ORF Transcript_25920/g.62243 Transcript_25920/m.62243 type:complete len:207 (-) Transcript_25920:574-1194(-)